ncbi:hypothetical protein [Cupriavidus pampae]|uniref:Uncharacterized protein n=1 Tax=Cupriavidus pampae TaxID=659251 RepID=A0ABN7ZIE0_9BURK|nr:hypothetical protein [Cupriavidus pampae]CAG9184755.1 hypothetical protein LMG32289_05726 [Cupriavidus pampae]
MEALRSSLTRLSQLAQSCAEALSGAAAAASDPQARAVLGHRANMQRCAAGELATRACACDDASRAGEGSGGSDTGASQHRRDIAAAAPPADTSEIARLRHAAQQVARAAAAYGSVMRDPLPDPELRLLLAHYYRGATELQRMLEFRVAEFTPSRQGNGSSASTGRRGSGHEATHR